MNRVPDRVRRAAPGLAQKRHAHAGVVHHEAISHHHAAGVIVRRQHHQPVRRCPDLPVQLGVGLPPSPDLVFTGERQQQGEILAPVPLCLKRGISGQRVKPHGAAADKPTEAGTVQGTDHGFRLGPERLKRDKILRPAVAGEADAPVPQCRVPDLLGQAQVSSIFSTARKASLGTWTVPNWRMRFLPSFCFSSSFFFRVISPP